MFKHIRADLNMYTDYLDTYIIHISLFYTILTKQPGSKFPSEVYIAYLVYIPGSHAMCVCVCFFLLFFVYNF